MSKIVVDLAISSPEMLRYYRGQGQAVVAYARDGRTIRFPARWLRPHVGLDGVHGTFVLEVDAQHRLRRFMRVANPQTSKSRA